MMELGTQYIMQMPINIQSKKCYYVCTFQNTSVH
jgi:hypothetical protein